MKRPERAGVTNRFCAKEPSLCRPNRGKREKRGRSSGRASARNRFYKAPAAREVHLCCKYCFLANLPKPSPIFATSLTQAVLLHDHQTGLVPKEDLIARGLADSVPAGTVQYVQQRRRTPGGRLRQATESGDTG